MPVPQPELTEQAHPEPILPEPSSATTDDEPGLAVVDLQVNEPKTPEKPKLKSPWEK